MNKLLNKINKAKGLLKSIDEEYISSAHFGAGIIHWIQQPQYILNFLQKKRSISVKKLNPYISAKLQYTNHVFTFINLFMKAGFFRITGQLSEGKCVYPGGRNKFALKTYVNNIEGILYWNTNQSANYNMSNKNTTIVHYHKHNLGVLIKQEGNGPTRLAIEEAILFQEAPFEYNFPASTDRELCSLPCYFGVQENDY